MLAEAVKSARLDDVVEFLRSDQLTGALRLGSERWHARIYLIDGMIVGVYTDDPALDLGRFLLREGLLDPVRLEAAERIVRRVGEPLDEIIVRTGVMTPAVLEAARERHAIEAVLSFGVARELEMEFASDELPEGVSGDLSIAVDKLAAELEKRAPLIELLKRTLGAERGELRYQPQEGAAADGMEGSVLELLRQGANLDELCAKAGLGRLRTLEALHALRERGAVALPATPAPAGGIDSLLGEDLPADVIAQHWISEGERLLGQGQYCEAIQAFQQAQTIDPSQPSTEELLEAARRMFAEVRGGTPRPADGPGCLRVVASADAARQDPMEQLLLNRLREEPNLMAAVMQSPEQELELLEAYKRLRQDGLVEPVA